MHSHLNFDLKNLKFKFSEKADQPMTFSGYASVFGNVDHTNDIVMKGCFEKSLSKRMPKVCLQHNTSELPAKLTSAKEDDYGLYVEGYFIDTQLGRDTYTQVKEGVIDQMSIGYVTGDSEWKDDVRCLKSVDLYEVSFVTFPANEKAKITMVKNLPTNIREFESMLVSKGFSKKLSNLIASNSFDAIQRDAEQGTKENQRDADNKEVLHGLKELINTIKGN